eukprot:gene1135-2197_t
MPQTTTTTYSGGGTAPEGGRRSWSFKLRNEKNDENSKVKKLVHTNNDMIVDDLENQNNELHENLKILSAPSKNRRRTADLISDGAELESAVKKLFEGMQDLDEIEQSHRKDKNNTQRAQNKKLDENSIHSKHKHPVQKIIPIDDEAKIDPSTLSDNNQKKSSTRQQIIPTNENSTIQEDIKNNNTNDNKTVVPHFVRRPSVFRRSIFKNDSRASVTANPNNRFDTFSRALAVMDFQMEHDFADRKKSTPKIDIEKLAHDHEHDHDGETDVRRETTDYAEKEYRAASCCRQLVSLSTFVCIGQLCVLAYMVHQDGLAPNTVNPNIGPSAYTLVKYGGKDAWAIVEKGQWYRLISPVCLHAGVIHIATNVLIQLRIGGYLNRVFGSVRWLLIYSLSGIFGNMLSCIFLPLDVGVGSSGAVLGMSSSWLIWIIFRWRKIPKEARSQRNCQLLLISFTVGITLAFSFTPYVDWAMHFGGAGMVIVRVVGSVILVVVYLWALYTMVYDMKTKPLYPPMY